MAICNALERCIAIVFKNDGKNGAYDSYIFKPEDGCDRNDSLLYIYRQNNHYQSIVKKINVVNDSHNKSTDNETLADGNENSDTTVSHA